jgi:sugar (pentulose or hexulose) kinase
VGTAERGDAKRVDKGRPLECGESRQRGGVARDAGGGTRVDPWVQALADCTGLPVDVVAFLASDDAPVGGGLGAADTAH